MRGLKRVLCGLLAVAMVCQNAPITVKAANESKIALNEESIKAKSANGHDVKLAIDGKKDTYWQTIPSSGEGDQTQQAYSSMYAHNHYIDITLDGTYQLSEIKVFNNVDGSYSNYYIYASTDGKKYDKIVSKTSDTLATADGDSHAVDVQASYLRINMAYNSKSYTTNLAELEIYGTKQNDTVKKPADIQVEDWNNSTWKTEWDRFATNPVYAEQKVIKEMGNLVERVIGNGLKDKFVFQMRGSLADNQDIFELKDGPNDTIIISGNNGIAMASGFNYYLKYYLNLDYNPLFGSNVDTTDKSIVPIGKKIVKEAQYNLRYALNFCTYSYTMAFWNWDEYEEFLDWCAMNGINLVLDIVGQEEVLRQTFLEYGFTNEEIKDYICGPAYFAWFYMQNLYSVGGPLPDTWFEQRVDLGRRMHDRMQTYGINPVLQGFSGQVPETFTQKNTGAYFTPVDGWPGHTRPALLKPYADGTETDYVDYFTKVADTFYAKQKNVFGDISDYYATDPFHEGGNIGSLDIATIFEKVQKKMLEKNENAMWVMQQWQGNLNSTKMSKLDVSHCIALDLQADMNPQHGLFEQNGTPWIYCMLHNFGGRMGLDGEVPVISKDPIETAHNTKNMTGIGITPEALENSPIVYELFLETTWSKDPIEYNQWVDQYAKRRAGGTNEALQKAWDILVDTAYADKGVTYQGAAETVINARPGDSFGSASTWGHSGIYYDKAQLDQALKLLAENYDTFSKSLAYKYDLADVAEQLLCNAAVEYHKLMVAAKSAGDVEQFETLSNAFLGLIDLSDKILSTTDEFMLGTWITAARKMITGADDWTKDLFEFNARALVTTWGGEKPANNGGLKDYSNRKWSGLTSGFYKERWSIWIRNRIAEMKKTAKDPADQKAESNWFLWEFQWVNRKSDDDGGKYAFSATPTDADLGELALQAYNDYSYTNLEKNTGASTEEKINIVAGKKPTLTKGTTAEGNLENITDGDTGTEWKGTGTDSHVLEFDLGGDYEMNEIVFMLPQLAKKFPYTYQIEIYNTETDTWNQIAAYSAQEGLDSKNSITVTENGTGSKVRFTFATTDAADAPLTIAEIEIYGTAVGGAVEELENLALNQTAEVTISGGGITNSNQPLKNITDGKEDTFWGVQWVNNYESLFPTTVKVPLQRMAYVDYMEVSFEPTKSGETGRPFKFYVQVVKEDGTIEKIYNEYESHTGTLPTVPIKISVEQTVKEVIVCMNGTTKQGDSDASAPSIAEIKVMGTPVEYRNVAQGILPTTNKTNTDAGFPLTNITDGNTENLWKTAGWGTGEYPAWVTVTLPEVTDIGYLDLYFEKVGLPFKFYVYVTDADGKETTVYDEYKEYGNKEDDVKDVLPDRHFKIPVNKEIKSATVYWTGITEEGSAYEAGPAISEFMLMSPQPVQGQAIDFTEGKISGVTVSGGNATNKVLDGNKTGTWDVVTQNAEIVFELPDLHYVKNADFTFEKGELGLKYMVYAEDENGNRTLVCDKSQTKELLGNATVRIPVEQAAKKIIFVHMGNNGQGTAYLAESRLYEFEVYGGKPISALQGAAVTPDAAKVLLDNQADTIYTTQAETPIIVTLAKPTDVSMVSVTKSANETQNISYKAEYYDGKNWKELASVSGMSDQEVFAIGKEPVFTDKVRFTIPAGLEISEVQVYKADRTRPLADRIAEIRAILSGLSYDGTNGSYTQEAKETLEAKLSEAETAIAEGISSNEVTTWIETVNKALDTFYKTGIVYVDRAELLTALSDAQQMLRDMERIGLTGENTELQTAYDAANQVYITYKVTQANIDAAEQTLAGTTEKLMKYYDLSTYKGTEPKENWSAPKAEGKVFAGWYTDSTCKKVYDGTTGIAYPKFVNEAVLNTKGQVPMNAKDITEGSGDKTRLRLVSTIDDCLDYKQVGFHINYTYNGTDFDFDTASMKVYNALYDVEGIDAIQPTAIAEDSKYFFTYSITSIPYEAFNTQFEVKAYWITKDGTKVYGASRAGEDALSVNKGIAKNQEVLR